jgi:hypothetical protein
MVQIHGFGPPLWHATSLRERHWLILRSSREDLNLDIQTAAFLLVDDNFGLLVSNTLLPLLRHHTRTTLLTIDHAIAFSTYHLKLG